MRVTNVDPLVRGVHQVLVSGDSGRRVTKVNLRMRISLHAEPKRVYISGVNYVAP